MYSVTWTAKVYDEQPCIYGDEPHYTVNRKLEFEDYLEAAVCYLDLLIDYDLMYEVRKRARIFKDGTDIGKAVKTDPAALNAYVAEFEITDSKEIEQLRKELGV